MCTLSLGACALSANAPEPEDMSRPTAGPTPYALETVSEPRSRWRGDEEAEPFRQTADSMAAPMPAPQSAPAPRSRRADLAVAKKSGARRHQPPVVAQQLETDHAPPNAAGNTHTDHGVNPFTITRNDALSTFSIDVDTASYTLSRRALTSGRLPPEAAVRVEEFVNYFDYDSYAEPTDDTPFAVAMEAMPHPFRQNRHILRVGVQGGSGPQRP